MTKEQMAEAMAQVNAENATLKHRVEELESANKTVAEKLNQSENRVAENLKKISDLEINLAKAHETVGDLERDITDLTAANPRNDQIDLLRNAKIQKDVIDKKTDDTIFLLEKVKQLIDVVNLSCADHCPHHANPEACRNCSINQKMIDAGVARSQTPPEFEKMGNE